MQGIGRHISTGIAAGSVGVALAEYYVRLLKCAFRDLPPNKDAVSARIGDQQLTIFYKNAPRGEKGGTLRSAKTLSTQIGRISAGEFRRPRVRFF